MVFSKWSKGLEGAWGGMGLSSGAVPRDGMCLLGSPAPRGCAQESWNPLQNFMTQEQKALAWSVFGRPQMLRS